jgi:hypothetical protein
MAPLRSYASVSNRIDALLEHVYGFMPKIMEVVMALSRVAVAFAFQVAIIPAVQAQAQQARSEKAAPA